MAIMTNNSQWISESASIPYLEQLAKEAKESIENDDLSQALQRLDDISEALKKMRIILFQLRARR
jgi:hypothetical protein